MYDGTKFWAMNKYVIAEEIERKTANNVEAKTKITEYVKHDTKVKGIGTYENPYIFVDSYRITITAIGEGNIKFGSEAKTRTITKGVPAGGSITVQVVPNNGFKYLNNSCNSIASLGDDGLSFNGIDKDMQCEVTFTASKDSITLDPPCEKVITDFAGTNTYCFNVNGTNTFFYKFGEGYYRNEGLTKLLGELLYPPFLEGWTFDGYTIGDTIDLVKPVSKDSRIAYEFEKSYTVLTKDNKGNIKGHGHANTYDVTFDKQGGSSVTSSKKIQYAHDLPTIDLPTRTGYRFQVYFTEADGKGTKYYNADGSPNSLWWEPRNTTLYAYWLPDYVKLNLDNGGAEVSGTTVIYQRYGVGYYTSTTSTTQITSISIPKKATRWFTGYYAIVNGVRTKIIDEDGKILASNTTFQVEQTLSSDWTDKTCDFTWESRTYLDNTRCTDPWSLPGTRTQKMAKGVVGTSNEFDARACKSITVYISYESRYSCYGSEDCWGGQYYGYGSVIGTAGRQLSEMAGGMSDWNNTKTFDFTTNLNANATADRLKHAVLEVVAGADGIDIHYQHYGFYAATNNTALMSFNKSYYWPGHPEGYSISNYGKDDTVTKVVWYRIY